MTNDALIERPAEVLPPPTELRQMAWMAEQFLKSGLLPSAIKTPQAALLIIQKGRELGIQPTYALSNIAIIEGKPTAGAELLAALIYRDHGDEALRVIETTDERCTIAYRRRSWKEAQRFTFSIDDAKRAGLLGKQNWQKYLPAMLRARAISAVARMAFPDSIGGMYTAEEMGAEVEMSAEGQIEIVEMPVLSEPRPIPAEVAQYAVEAGRQERESSAPPQQQQHSSPPPDRPALADELERACKQLANARKKGETWKAVMAGVAKTLGLSGSASMIDYSEQEWVNITRAARTQTEILSSQGQDEPAQAPPEEVTF